jgi:MFS transporter, ACS family, D-galactonate transporter
VTPLVVGLIVSATGSFALALGFIALLAIGGVFSYLFLLGDVRRVELDGA